MSRISRLLALLATACACHSNAALTIYPDSETSYNPAVPIIKPVAGGLVGNCFPLSVDFAYRLAPYVDFTKGGELSLGLRDHPRRRLKKVMVLSDGGATLSVQIAPASQGRTISVLWQKPGRRASKVVSDAAIGTEWSQLALSWADGEVSCALNGQAAVKLPIDPGFNPKSVNISTDLVDELKLIGDGVFSLGWEQGYAAQITPGSQGTKVQARLLGFDSFVVSDQPDRRDTPTIKVLNGGAESREVSFQFRMHGEVDRTPRSWEQKVAVGAGQDVAFPMLFPTRLGTDVYHLTVTAKGVSEDFIEAKDFLHVVRRDEPGGASHFALHDSNRHAFGAWPDAMPVNVSHVYARWGEIVGPFWEKDNHDGYGMDPSMPPEQWNWDYLMDRGAAEGRQLYVSVESTPRQKWMRSGNYTEPGSMKTYSWGEMGGRPDLEQYKRFADALAQKYAGKVAWYEVDNEPYYLNHCGKRPGDYVQIAWSFAEVVRPIDPQAKIVANVAIGKSHEDWTRTVFDSGIARWVDAISLHTYTTPRSPDDADLPSSLQDIRRLIKATGRPLTLLNSETGVYTALREQIDQPLSPERLAELIKDGTPGLAVPNGWPHYALDEKTAGISMVRNVVDNFAAGSRLFTFFGWNVEWPKLDWWSNPAISQAAFAVISATMDGRRTPSQFTLAVAVLTAQLEGIRTGDDAGAQSVDQGGVSGGLFKKENGGEVAVLWSALGERSVLIQTPTPELEIVTRLGEVRHDVALGKTAPFLHVLKLDESPVYLHSPGVGIEVIPSPVVGTKQLGQDEHELSLEFSLLNRGRDAWRGAVEVSLPDGWKLAGEAPSFNLAPLSRQSVPVRCKLPADVQPGAYSLTCKINLANGRPFAFPVPVLLRPSHIIRELPAQSKPASLTVSNNGATLAINTPDQVVLGRPPQLASLQEDKYWKGPSELAGLVTLGYTATHLLVRVDVQDTQPRLPDPWPGVMGSCVELFFDFRPASKRAQGGGYEPGVHQIILKPALEKDQSVEIWDASSKVGTLDGLQAEGGRIDDRHYWVALSIPWASTGMSAKAGESFGFDVGIDGPDANGPLRKSQLMLYGTSINNSDTSSFGNMSLGGPR